MRSLLHPTESYPITDNYSPPGMVRAVPHELLVYRSWIGWKYGAPRPNGKRAKEPINPRTGRKAKPNDPTTWGTFEEAVAAVERFGLEGVGFVFSENDPFAGVDTDDCIDADGVVHPDVEKIVKRLGGYSEISPSGTGIKIIVKASKPGDKCRAVGPWGGEIEMYDSSRFFTVTGRVYHSIESIPNAQKPVEALYRRIWPEGKATTQKPVGGAPSGFSGDDNKLLKTARNARNGWKFRALYDNGDLSLYGDDHSRADQALCEMTAFYTGGDPERMDRLFRGSALYRPKWEREDYRTATIEKARARCTKTYTGKMPDADGEAQERLARVLDDVRRDPWNYPGGATDRKVYRAFVVTGGGEARTYRDGVIVDPTRPEIALEASVNEKKTLPRSIERMHERGKLEILERGGWGKKAKYLLTPSSKVHHRDTPPPCEYYGVGLTTLPTHKMRGVYNPPRKAFDKNGNPTPNYVGHPEKRLPPKCGHVSDVVEELGVADFFTLADRMGATTRQARDNLKRRYVTPSVDRGLLIHKRVDGRDLYTHPHDAAERFADYLENSGCNYGEQRQIEAIAKAQEMRELYRRGDRTFEEEYPAWVDAVMRDGPPEPPEPDGYIEDLERVEEIPVEDHHEHDLGCECIDCSIPAPMYAIPYARAA